MTGGQRAARSHPASQVNAGRKSLHMGTRRLLDMSRPVTAGAARITADRARSASSQTSADPRLAPPRMPPVTHVPGTGRVNRLRITTAHGQNVLMRVTPVPADPGGTGQARTTVTDEGVARSI